MNREQALARLRHTEEHRVEQPRLHAVAAPLERAEDLGEDDLEVALHPTVLPGMWFTNPL